MTTASKHSKSNYTKYMPNYDYSKVNEWSMNEEESNAILDEATSLYEAGDKEGYRKTIKKLPLAPNIALQMRDEMGKEALLAEGCNLADAEIVYGKNWLDEYMVD